MSNPSGHSMGSSKSKMNKNGNALGATTSVNTNTNGKNHTQNTNTNTNTTGQDKGTMNKNSIISSSSNGTSNSNGSNNETKSANNGSSANDHNTKPGNKRDESMSSLQFSINCVNQLTKQNGAILANIDTFSFDIWEYVKYDSVKQNPLLTLGMYIIIHAKYLQPILQSSQLQVLPSPTPPETKTNNNGNGKASDTGSIYIFPKPDDAKQKQSQSGPHNHNHSHQGQSSADYILTIIDNHSNKKHQKATNCLGLNYCANFLKQIESTYNENPYHNKTHAADVTQFAHVLLTSLWTQNKLSSTECLAILMAAASHDAGHGGKNNDFLIKSKSTLVSEHGAPSVLENYHLHRTFELINNNNNSEKYSQINDLGQGDDASPNTNASKQATKAANNSNKAASKKSKAPPQSQTQAPAAEEDEHKHGDCGGDGSDTDCNFFQTFSESEQNKMEKLIRYAIIGTDMGTYHKSIRDELTNPKDKPKNIYTSEYTEEWQFSEKLFIGRAMLHMADISNPLRKFAVARLWADRILTEFFEQGDLMKEMNLPVSFGCDRDQVKSRGKNQNGFLNLFVLPLAQLIEPLIPPMKELISNNNQKHWNNLEKEEQQPAADSKSASASSNKKNTNSSNNNNSSSKGKQ